MEGYESDRASPGGNGNCTQVPKQNHDSNESSNVAGDSDFAADVAWKLLFNGCCQTCKSLLEMGNGFEATCCTCMISFVRRIPTEQRVVIFGERAC